MMMMTLLLFTLTYLFIYNQLVNLLVFYLVFIIYNIYKYTQMALLKLFCFELKKKKKKKEGITYYSMEQTSLCII
jgi:hypothetical protein